MQGNDFAVRNVAQKVAATDTDNINLSAIIAANGKNTENSVKVR